MKLSNVARVMGQCLRHPRRSYRSVLRLTEPDDAGEFARQFLASGAVLPPCPGPDPGCSGSENPLREFFESRREGRGIWKWEHYFDIYQRHLSKFVGRAPHVVEIGIYSGGSLEMWRDYFGAGCRVSGIDIQEECKAYEDSNTSIYIGDQADRGFWKGFRDEAPAVDILIDDGGHTAEQQRVTLEEILSHLRPGGVYLCEDVHGADSAFAAYTRRLAALLNGFDMLPRTPDGGLASAPTPFQQMINSIHFYPFVVVIERADRPVDCFRAPKHGTEWQPFLS